MVFVVFLRHQVLHQNLGEKVTKPVHVNQILGDYKTGLVIYSPRF